MIFMTTDQSVWVTHKTNCKDSIISLHTGDIVTVLVPDIQLQGAVKRNTYYSLLSNDSFFMGITTISVKSNILNNFMVVAIISLDRWQHHTWF
jgi:hypothetical protein